MSRNILSKRQILLRELFVLIGLGEKEQKDGDNKDEDAEEARWTAFWENVDLTTLDDSKLKSFLDKYKLRQDD